jgi:microcystin-dependent protein
MEPPPPEPVSNFSELYSVIGDNFGGKGTTIFDLPTLSQSRVGPVNVAEARYRVCHDRAARQRPGYV